MCNAITISDFLLLLCIPCVCDATFFLSSSLFLFFLKKPFITKYLQKKSIQTTKNIGRKKIRNKQMKIPMKLQALYKQINLIYVHLVLCIFLEVFHLFFLSWMVILLAKSVFSQKRKGRNVVMLKCLNWRDEFSEIKYFLCVDRSIVTFKARFKVFQNLEFPNVFLTKASTDLQILNAKDKATASDSWCHRYITNRGKLTVAEKVAA